MGQRMPQPAFEEGLVEEEPGPEEPAVEDPRHHWHFVYDALCHLLGDPQPASDAASSGKAPTLPFNGTGLNDNDVAEPEPTCSQILVAMPRLQQRPGWPRSGCLWRGGAALSWMWGTWRACSICYAS